MPNFTEQESKLLLYLKIAKDIGAKDIIINKLDCETIINLVERLIKEVNKNDEQ